MLNIFQLKSLVRKLFTPKHEHGFEVIREAYAPTGPPPEHTKFMILRCPCGLVQLFPQSNFDLTTSAFQGEFRAYLKARGWRLEEP